MSKLGLRPSSSGGMSEPRRLLVPLPGAKEPFLLPTGVTSLITSILGASGALISGTFGYDKSEINQWIMSAANLIINAKRS